MCAWQLEHSRAPRFALNGFVRAISALLPEDTSLKDVQSSLTRALMLEEGDLGQDPGPLMAVRMRERASGAAAPGPPPSGAQGGAAAVPVERIETFTVLLEDFLERAGAEDEEAARRALEAALKGLPGAAPRGADGAGLAAWLRSAQAPRDLATRPEALAGLLHAAYVAVCDRLGPVTADRLLAGSLAECEHSPAGKRCSPRRFL